MATVNLILSPTLTSRVFTSWPTVLCVFDNAPGMLNHRNNIPQTAHLINIESIQSRLTHLNRKRVQFTIIDEAPGGNLNYQLDCLKLFIIRNDPHCHCSKRVDCDKIPSASFTGMDSYLHSRTLTILGLPFTDFLPYQGTKKAS